MSFEPIENHGVIGNMRAIALVSVNGSIDFLCYPDFDSPSIFAALLDDEKGGRFSIEPQLHNRTVRQLYLPETNILLTRFLAEEGVVELTDYMPVGSEGEQSNAIIRSLYVIRGEITFKILCEPRFNYSKSGHTVHIDQGSAIFSPEDTESPRLALRSTVPLHEVGNDAGSEFTLRTGEKATFILFESSLNGKQPHVDSILAYQETTRFWKWWIGKSKYKGRWREMVNRSALMLKLLISREHGSLIAAPTFSLPEEIGGVRNWDYRFTWLRDSAFTLYALLRLGFVKETEAFMKWLKERLNDDAERGPLQVMYGIDGRSQLDEIVLDHLKGYQSSAPVRIGNAAYQQLQLDIYGDMMDSAYLANKYGEAISYSGWQNVQRVLDWLSKNWERPDEGIWEVRGGAKEFLHSRLMCWVAFDRALRLADKRSLSAPLEAWRRTRDAIRADIIANFWDKDLQSFVQSKGAKVVDASSLLMPLMRFISPTDPMWLSTMKALEEHLVEDALVRRYSLEGEHVDGISGGEGTFTACSFWYVECLARAGQLEKLNCCSRNCWGMRIILDSTPNKSVKRENTWGISLRHSHTSR